ncbi:MAG: hypothetical protein M1818_001165 [Claussenomyces sp. TS43310]|nr:MAG: hypothetical protein M1818_001165 [Claussenomyces sp. TS43310]
MTRTLPWARARSGGSNTSRPEKSLGNPYFPSRTNQVANPGSISDVGQILDDEVDIRATTVFQGRAPSTSPPAAPFDPPEEVFMIEGLENDDKYRMVEDEFLSTAKEFTQHLHAAEYKRMKKAARSQNAATINSISRPVTMKMPDSTRRKVEGVARSRKQANTVHGLLAKQGDNSDTDLESDGPGVAWLGTALHGLMDSPKRSAASLLKVGTIAVNTSTSTKAGAGSRKMRGTRISYSKSTAVTPPQPKDLSSPIDTADTAEERASDTSDDEDLDGPVRAIQQNESVKDESSKKALDTSSGSRLIAKTPRESKLYPILVGKNTSRTVQHPRITTKTAEESTDLPSRQPSSLRAARIARRLEQARSQKPKKDQEERKKNLDIIPSFL